jgi:prevent-host-death family protein
MSEVGVRALKQNASAVVARAASGESVTITDRGRPVAQMIPLGASQLLRMVESGRARPARRALRDLPAPLPGPSLSACLAASRDQERY